MYRIQVITKTEYSIHTVPDLYAKVNPASIIDKWMKDLLPRNSGIRRSQDF